jgi:hypothetical protein
VLVGTLLVVIVTCGAIFGLNWRRGSRVHAAVQPDMPWWEAVIQAESVVGDSGLLVDCLRGPALGLHGHLVRWWEGSQHYPDQSAWREALRNTHSKRQCEEFLVRSGSTEFRFTVRADGSVSGVTPLAFIDK